MKDFLSRNKGFIIAIIATLALIFGGITLLSRSGNGSPTVSGDKVNSSILIPQGAEETSGIVNGQYLPASSSTKVTLVEFGDYECPACAIYTGYVKEFLTADPGKVNFVFRNYPIPSHTNSQIAADAVVAAGLQGKFWQMHDTLYSDQTSWENSTDPKSVLDGYAQTLGLNMDKFNSDLASSQVKDIVTADYNDGNTVGLTETPTFYLNNHKIDPLPSDYQSFQDLINGAINSQ